MINFFRKTRKKLADDNKFLRYSRYAIGEITLVMIGILLALQVNTWNEERKAQKEEKIIYTNLIQEFQENRLTLHDRINLLNNSIDNCNLLMNLMAKPNDVILSKNVDSIINNAWLYGNFNPSNSAILELIQSGRLKHLSNSKIKNKINDWLKILKDTDEDFKNQDLHFNEQLVPFLSERISLKNVNNYGNQNGLNVKSELVSNYYSKLFQDFEFENLISTGLFWHIEMRDHYKELDSLAIEIILLLEH